jgi:translocation and assembly module TamB
MSPIGAAGFGPWRAAAKWVAIALGLFVCLLAAGYGLREHLIAPRLAVLIQEKLSQELGLEVAIGRLTGSLVTDIEISDLQTAAPGTRGQVSSLSARRLHLRYSPLTLLRGIAGFVEGMRVDIEGLQAELDLDRGDPSSLEKGPSPRWPWMLPVLHVRDAGVAIRRGDFHTRFNGITFNAEKDAGEGRRMRMSVGEWSWSHPGLAAGKTSAAAELALTADAIVIRQLSLGRDRVVAHGRVGPAGPNASLPFEAGLQFREGRIDLAGDFNDSVLNAKLKADQVEIEPMASLFLQAFSGRLSADIELSVPFARPETGSGRMRLDVSNAKIRGIELDNAGLDATLADGWVRAAAFEAAFGHSRLTISEAAAPLRRLLDGAWGDVLQALSGRFALACEDLPALLKMIGLASDAPLASIPEHRLELAGRFDAGYLHIPSGSLTAGSNRIALKDLETRLPPAPADTPLKGDLRLDLPDLKTVAAVLPLVSLSGSVKADATIGGTFGRPEADAVLTAEGLSIDGLPVGNVSLNARCARQQILVKTLSIQRGADSLSGRGSIRLPAGDIDAAELSFAVADLEWLSNFLLPATWTVAGARPRIQGRAQGQARLSGHWSSPDGELSVALDDLRLQGQRFGKMRAAGRLTRNAAGKAIDATLDEFSLKGEEVLLTLEAPAQIRYEAGRRLRIDRFAAGGPQGRIAVSGQLALEGRSDLVVELAEVNGAGWLGPLAGIPLSLNGVGALLRVEGTAAAPEIHLTGTVRELGAEGQPVTLAGRFDLTFAGRRLRIDACDWTSPAGHRVALAGTLPIDPAADALLAPGALAVTATASIPDQELLRRLVPAWPITAGAIEAGLELEGTWAAPRGALRLNGRDLTPAESSRFLPPGPYEARAEMAIDAHRILLQTVEVQCAHAQLKGAGVWQGYPAFSQWAAGRPPPEGSVALEGRLAAPDLGWLARGFKDIRRTAGRLDMEVKMEGPLRDPRLQADLRLTDGELRPEADMPPLQALSLDAGLADRDVTVRSLRGELGGAPFEVTGVIEDILAADGHRRVDLRLAGQNLLLHRSQALRARADADLRLVGPAERLVLSGNLSFTDGLFAKNFGLAEGLTAGSAKPRAGPGLSLFSLEAPPFRDLRFDVRISARKPFQIKNNLVKGAFRPDLVLAGTGETPELVGKVYLDATTLYLPAGRMQFDSGVIHFEAADPGRPRLDMTGTARMIGYDITAAVEGPYDEPSVSLSSVPPLPDAELLALVLTGQPPKSPGSMAVERRQGLNVAVFIGRDVLMRMPGGGTTESLQTVLERFDVELGRSVTRAGDETINARFRVADGVLRKGDTLYLTGEKDVFDHYNAGVRIVFRFR